MLTDPTRIKNSTNDHSACPAIIKFCGSPTIVITPPNAEPTPACMSKLRKNARNSSKIYL